MRQRIYPDAYGVDTWDASQAATVHVHIANSMMWREITGEAPPPTPVSARTYTEYGLPWFELYDEHRGDIALSAELAGVKSVKDIDAVNFTQPRQDDSAVAVAAEATVVLTLLDSAPASSDHRE